MPDKTHYPLNFLITPELLRRFWIKVDKRSDNECWPWLGAQDLKYLYGRFGVNGLVYRAHRVSCFIAHGHPTDNIKIFACHSCDNPPCCNPNHLHWDSKKFNSRDRDSKRRHWLMKNPKGQNGTRNPNAKLTEQTIRDIKRANGTQNEIAQRYGVSQSHVSRIRLGQRRSED